MKQIDIFKDYENAKLDTVQDFKRKNKDLTVRFRDLPHTEISGIPVCLSRNSEKELEVTFVQDSHLLAIGATRSGKTTGFVVPTMNILAKRKNKPSLVISDPKLELYCNYASMFEKEGYNVKLLNFIDSKNSDCWNPLTKIYRAYKKYLETPEFEYVRTKKGVRRKIDGIICETDRQFYDIVDSKKNEYLDIAESGINQMCDLIVPAISGSKDPYWDDSARDFIKAIFYGMLEDIKTGKITEETFSFDTLVRIFSSFSCNNSSGYFNDLGFFTKRDRNSKALQMAEKGIIDLPKTTRSCVFGVAAVKLTKFRDVAIRKVTCTNTIDMSELDSEEPTVIFLAFKDEESLHYDIISMFLKDLYSGLIAISRRKKKKLDRPFYFLLDEFGNLPEFKDFDKVVSACGGRNIWFLIIIQSYSQLYNVYGNEVAGIIKDNMNIHLFFGTNNPDTKNEFSRECGKTTVISPLSAANGTGEKITSFAMDTVSLVPVSRLDRLKEGECIVTRMRENVVFSYMERCYKCPEMDYEKVDVDDRKAPVNFTDPKYRYNINCDGKDDDIDDDDIFA